MEEVQKVTYEGKELILVGTNHALPTSPILVKQVIEEELPDTVCVELDEKRYENKIKEKNWEDTDIIQLIKEKKVVLFLVQLFYGALQKKLAKKNHSSKAGLDMSAAIESCEKIHAHLELVDRDIQVTFKKMWRSLSFLEKVKLPFMALEGIDEENLTKENLGEFSQSDLVDTAFLSLKESLPGPFEELVSNRDSYLSMKIKNAPGKKIVAVVGKAHVKGIMEKLTQDFDLTKMDELPKKKWTSKLLSWLFPLIIVGLIAFSFLSGAENGFNQLSAWLLSNSALAALFTALSLGHPLTILVAFLTAPIGTLSPVLAVGFFTAISEAWVRKPRVKDFQNMQEDIFHVKTFMKNRALKILLIFFTSSLGGALGNLIGSLQIIRHLF